MNYKLSSLATSDLGKIADYTLENFGLNQSREYKKGLMESFRLLTANPQLGESAREFHPDLRRFVYQSHTIFYKPTKEGVSIVRVLGQSMDTEQHL